ncbi:peptidoglycan-binding protein (plasmid) [Streptomyces chartreusis]|uniref:peptidoglycan-binding protein n=1 Tax=Streptomyces chartreusis TaxID=1969 RepID=UPI0037DCBF80|nr:peptidoglycan-binding protein [Streptomyces chartreusis]
MTRAKNTTDEPEQQTAVPEGDTPALAVPAAGDDSTGRYEPYPGAEFFHGGRNSEIVLAMARRLGAEGHGDGRHLGPDWTNAHRDAFARFQHTLRPKGSGDVSGIPDETAWDRLQVPRVTPLPQES